VVNSGCFEEGAIEQVLTIRLAVIGVVFFLAASVLLDLVFMLAMSDYWFHQHLPSGVSLLVFDALNLAAVYGSWRTKRWGYVVAILLALFIVATTVEGVFFGGDTIGGPAQVVYTITMILIRLLIVFFAVSALLLQRSARAQP
jgi:hypothetical protein